MWGTSSFVLWCWDGISRERLLRNIIMILTHLFVLCVYMMKNIGGWHTLVLSVLADHVALVIVLLFV